MNEKNKKDDKGTTKKLKDSRGVTKKPHEDTESEAEGEVTEEETEE